MRVPVALCALAIFASTVAAQSPIEVGAGAPSDYVRGLFTGAYFRGSFSRIAGPPTGPVRRFGTTGLIQEFTDASRVSGRMALVKASSLATPDDPYGDVYQVATDVYAYYTTVGAGTAGYPIQDTLSCPGAPCQYQAFTSSIVLFAYPVGANDPASITLRDPFFTKWQALSGISGLGGATTAEQSVTSTFGGVATAQMFSNGALFNITSGALTGRFVSVRQPIWALYQSQKAHAGPLGYPTGEELMVANGRKRQTFEGGAIEYDANSAPAIRVPVQAVSVRPADTPVRLNVGQSLTVQAQLMGQDGTELTDRTVVFVTSNSRVVTVQSTGVTATLKAVGGGVATVSATSEGKTSTPIQVVVISTCCSVGEGAPTNALQQAFQDAVSRNRLMLRLPGGERVQRTGPGYVQEFTGNDGARYLLAVSDKTGQAFVVSGAILTRYEQLGGPASATGYPASDVTAGGRQMFDGGALAGNPVRFVAGGILQKWSLLGFESGPLGAPATEASTVLTFTGTSGSSQAFQRGLIASSARGSYSVAGLILSRYAALSGAGGALGLPLSDEVGFAGSRKQEFEGGSIEYAPTDTEARATARDRKPGLIAAPAAVLPGSRVRLTVSGFPDGSSLRVAVTGEPDFIVKVANGAYSWEALVPAGTAVGTVRIKATDTTSAALTAEGEYRVRSAAEVRAKLEIVGGDTQSGAPGSTVSQPLRVMVKDEQGMALSGVAVRFSASPGAKVTPDSVDTDVNGIADARLRLPLGEGIALVTAESLRQIATFSARSTGATLQQFPKITQAASEPLLLAASAAILRYYQNAGLLIAPNGQADTATLGQFLRGFCQTDWQALQNCDGILSDGKSQVINLSRLPAFVGNALHIYIGSADPQFVRESISGGDPVLLVLSSGQVLVGMGIAENGAILVYDPVPATSKRTLDDYLNGSTRLQSVVQLLPGPASGAGFVVASWGANPILIGRSGECGRVLEIPISGSILRQRYCEGSETDYQLDLSGEGTLKAVVTDLAESGSRIEVAAGPLASFRISRPGVWLVVVPQQTTVPSGSIVNSASFTTDIAPGSMISIFGTGLWRTGSTTRVEVGGRTAQVLGAFPFQVNAVLPGDLTPGSYSLRVESSYGSTEQQIEVKPVAPAIFRAGTNLWAIVNTDGKINSANTPARRGQTLVIYCTGLGPVVSRAGFDVTIAPVSAIIDGEMLVSAYAGITPGYAGLYQVNVVVPPEFAVGLVHSLTLRASSVDTLPVNVAIQ